MERNTPGVGSTCVPVSVWRAVGTSCVHAGHAGCPVGGYLLGSLYCPFSAQEPVTKPRILWSRPHASADVVTSGQRRFRL